MRKETRDQKRSNHSVAAATTPELVFVVDVSSLTKKGFVGTTSYDGEPVDLDFDDEGTGVFLTAGMAGKLHVRKGSGLSLVIEGERNEVVQASVAGVGKELRISDPKVYYGVGREGGAIIRVRRI